MFTVVWGRSALEHLVEIWLEASSTSRQAITSAVDRIDSRLRRDPKHEGESRDADRRILLLAPVGVFFRVLPDDRTVRVLKVWRFR